MLRRMMLIVFAAVLAMVVATPAMAAEATGVDTANGWYEGEEIYYQALGVEQGKTEQGENQIYVIGKDRLHQAQVVLFVPGEPGYSPHWNVNVVHTTKGTTVQDIVDAGLASPHGVFGEGDEPLLFDDVEDILKAEALDLVTIDQPGVVVLCPIISEEAAEAPGNNQLPIKEPFTKAHLDATF